MEVSELVYNDNVEIKYDTLFDMGKRSVAQSVANFRQADEASRIGYDPDSDLADHNKANLLYDADADLMLSHNTANFGYEGNADDDLYNSHYATNFGTGDPEADLEDHNKSNLIYNKDGTLAWKPDSYGEHGWIDPETGAEYFDDDQTSAATASGQAVSVSENGTLSVSDTKSAVTTTTESDAKQAAAVQAATQALKTQYNSTSGSRLVKFDYTTGDDDSQRRAYFMIKGGETDLSALKKTIAAETGIEAIFKLFTVGTGFINFILTGLSENLQEKQSIMPTIGDHFAATFSGQDPQVMSINGLLPFDANSEQASWYMNFLKAYNFIFRASILARYKLQLILCVPDMATYICYPISFTSNIMSQSDNVIQFTMGAIVANKGIVGAYGLNPDITKALTVQEEVSNLNQESAKAKAEGKNVTPEKDGKKSSKITFLDKAAKAVQDTLQGKNDIGRAIQDVNKVVSSIKQVSGAVELVTGKSLIPAGIRKGLKIFSK